MIPLLYFYVISARSTLQGQAPESGPDALYRGEFENYSLPGYPDGPPADDADPPPVQENRRRLHPTYREPAYQPRRTFSEAISDTVPRLCVASYAFIMSVWNFEVRIQLHHLVFLHIFRHALVQGDVVQFYREWFVEISSLV